MKKIMNLYFNKSDAYIKINNIFNAGFDGCFTAIYDRDKIMSLEQIINYIREKNGVIPMLHCDYDDNELNFMWSSDNLNAYDMQKIADKYLKQIEKCKQLGIKNFVMHLFGPKTLCLNKNTLSYVQQLLTRCEELNINLCVENLYTEEQMIYIFDNLHSDNLKVCYDCGHKNFLTPNFDIVKKFNDKIICLHLHDNFGKTDDHLLLGQGNIDLDILAKELSTLKNVDCLSFEIKTKEKVGVKELKHFYFVLDNLDKNIQKYKYIN